MFVNKEICRFASLGLSWTWSFLSFAAKRISLLSRKGEGEKDPFCAIGPHPLASLSRATSNGTFGITQAFSLRCQQRPVTARMDWGEEPAQRSWGLRINAGGNDGTQLEDKVVYGNQIKILRIKIYTLNAQDDFSRIKTMKYWSQNLKDESRDPSHSLKLMKVWFDLKTISIGKLMERKEIKLCIMATFQESGAEDRDSRRTGKSITSIFFSFVVS